MSVRIKLDLFFKSANGVKCGKIISVMAPSEPTLKAFRFESPGMSAAKYFTLVKDFCPDYRRLKIWGVHFFLLRIGSVYCGHWRKPCLYPAGTEPDHPHGKFSNTELMFDDLTSFFFQIDPSLRKQECIFNLKKICNYAITVTMFKHCIEYQFS